MQNPGETEKNAVKDKGAFTAIYTPDFRVTHGLCRRNSPFKCSFAGISKRPTFGFEGDFY